jgi:hypothetical protein
MCIMGSIYLAEQYYNESSSDTFFRTKRDELRRN